MNASAMRLQGLSRSFDGLDVLDDLTLDIHGNEFVALVGPSGCGKTTLLHLLCGHDAPSRGNVLRSGRVRMIYQKDGLFPWLTAGENIRMGLRAIRNRGEQERHLRDLLAFIRLERFSDHYPYQLSGGMRQLVELARAIASDTDVLLMDEPFSSLDYLQRLRMRRELARMLAERPRTVVLVTHDIEEAAELADRLIVLSERPARIRGELMIDVPRPRSLTHPVVAQTIQKVLSMMGLNGHSHDTQAFFDAAPQGVEEN